MPHAKDLMPRLNASHREARTVASNGARFRPGVDNAGIDAKVAASALIGRPDLARDIAIGDWEVRFSALKTRLRLIVGQRRPSVPKTVGLPGRLTGGQDGCGAVDELLRRHPSPGEAGTLW